MEDMSVASNAEIRIWPQGPSPVTAALSVSMRFSFDARIIDALKQRIPWHDRSYDEATHIWYTTPAYLEVLKTLARQCDHAMLIDGNRWENLLTGVVYEQQELF
jgi:hypothetical protein